MCSGSWLAALGEGGAAHGSTHHHPGTGAGAESHYQANTAVFIGVTNNFSKNIHFLEDQKDILGQQTKDEN